MDPNQKRKKRLMLISLICTVFTLVGVLWFSGESLASTDAVASLAGSTKTASPDSVSAGGQVLYAIVLDNDSSSTGQVVVGDILPDEITTISDVEITPPGSALFTTDYTSYITFTVLSVPANSAITFTFQADIITTAQMGEFITNTATISSDGSILERSAVVEVIETPVSRIDVPWNNQLITNRGDFVVSGRVWTADQTPEFPDTPVIQTIVYVASGDYYDVQWNGVTGANSYVLQESVDETFYDVNEYEVIHPKTNWQFTGKTPGIYYYRVKAVGLGSSFWSNVESVTVPAANMALQIDRMISPNAPVASYQPVVEVHIKKVGDPDNTWQTADVALDDLGDWWNWTYTWTLPIEDEQQYIVQTRAKDLAGNFDPAKVDTVTVTIKNGERFVYLPLVIRYYPPIPYAPTLSIDSDDGGGNYVISWTYNHAFFTPTSYQFQEATDADFTSLTIDETRSSPQIFTGKEVGIFYYRVRGINAYGPGAWSNVQTIVVIDKRPLAPTLHVDSDNGQGDYTLSWTYDHALYTPTTYRFQEATDATFTTLIIDEIRSSPKTFEDKELGTFYYRVLGINSYGTGPWSNVQTILVEEKGFFDDFSDPSSGWLVGLYDATDSDAEDVIDFAYINNEYRMWITIEYDGSHNEKTGTVFAPYDNTASVYTVEVDQHWTEAPDVGGFEPMNSKAALIFAATDNHERIYSVEWNFEGKCKVWRNWEVSPPVDGVDLYHSDTFYGWKSDCGANGGYNATNHVKVEVNGTQARIFMNGNNFTTIDKSEIGSIHDVGLIVGSWDWTPVDSRYDNFRVTLP